MTKNGPIHCVKSVLIRSSFWSVFSRIQSECRKIRTRKNYVFEHCSRSDLVFHYYGHTTGIGTAISIKRDRYFTRHVFYAIGKIVSLIKPIFITKWQVIKRYLFPEPNQLKVEFRNSKVHIRLSGSFLQLQ